MSKKYTKIGRYIIEWDTIYYIAYAGGKRELSEKDLKEYNKATASGLPDLLKAREVLKLGFDKNPNVVPIKGIDLIELFKDRSFIPFFDSNFKVSRLLQINDQIIYESIKQKSYDLLKGL